MTLIANKDADQYLLRLPDGLREQIRERADANGRSMNTEIIAALTQWLLDEQSVLERLTRIERYLGFR